MTKPEDTTTPAVGSQLVRGVGRLVPERADVCAQGCNGCDDCTDYDDYEDWVYDCTDYDDYEDWVCDRCHGDGADPWTDYLLPCPACQGEQRP